MGAVRHFLRADPQSLEKREDRGRSLGSDVGSYEADPRHIELGKAVRLGKESVPIGRLDPTWVLTVAPPNCCGGTWVQDRLLFYIILLPSIRVYEPGSGL